MSTQKDAEKPSAATAIVEIAHRLYNFGLSIDGDTFAVPKRGPKVVSTLRGGKHSLRATLAREYYRLHKRAAPQQALADALLVLDGDAQQTAPVNLHLRVAQHDGAVWLDLGCSEGKAVRIDGHGWQVVERAPVLFRRTALTGVLPVPERGGSIDDLWPMVNISASDRPLLLAWIVACFWPEIAHPVLAFIAEQGCAKSSTERAVVSLVDASPVPLRKPPRDADTWVTAAAGSWLVGLDNLSEIPHWLSDSICRAVTGDGDVRRRLYTDGDCHVFAFRRCVLLNGIDVGVIRGDLAERMLPITVERIPDDRRKLDSEIWPAFDAVHPRLLGAVLDLVAGVAGVISGLRLDCKPRMADFARIVAGVDTILGTDGLAAYLGKQGELAADALSGDKFAQAIIEQMPHGFTGTSAEMLARLHAPANARGWPETARAITSRLRRLAPVLRKAGWQVSDDGALNHDKAVRWAIHPPKHPEMARIEHPQHPQHPHGAGYAGIAGIRNAPSQHDACQPDDAMAAKRARVLATGEVPQVEIPPSWQKPESGTVGNGCTDLEQTSEQVSSIPDSSIPLRKTSVGMDDGATESPPSSSPFQESGTIGNDWERLGTDAQESDEELAARLCARMGIGGVQ